MGALARRLDQLEQTTGGAARLIWGGDDPEAAIARFRAEHPEDAGANLMVLRWGAKR